MVADPLLSGSEAKRTKGGPNHSCLYDGEGQFEFIVLLGSAAWKSGSGERADIQASPPIGGLSKSLRGFCM